MPQQLQVFVSHSGGDQATCDKFVTALRAVAPKANEMGDG